MGLKNILLFISMISIADLLHAAIVDIRHDVELFEDDIRIDTRSDRYFYWKFDRSLPTYIDIGDQVSYTLNFINGKALKMSDLVGGNNNERAWPFLWTYPSNNNSSFEISNVNFEFLNPLVLGNAKTTMFRNSAKGGMVALGVSFRDFLEEGSSVTISGMKTTFVVDSISGGGQNYIPAPLFRAQELSIVSVSDNAKTFTLLFGSICALGLIRRRIARKRQVQPTTKAYA